jgi:predicted RNA-binding protein with PUA-like domain
MNWLLKTEPSEYSVDQFERDRRVTWDGVANALAQKHLRAMSKGDRVFIYHTGNERSVVAVAEVVRSAYPDPSIESAGPTEGAAASALVVVDLRFVKRLDRPVTLAEVKADKRLVNWDLIRLGRLSVVPTSDEVWNRVISLSENAV